ncbi:glycosyltransferase family 2 protein [Arthrobacter sp. UNC362MFTsu5.1]|uniref:glycosyltransferase family 2 protein n=1 Tax=Arthrobacter sp. UNC362MFTsu5.1 TaxID=1449044 RepID=UPI0009DF01F7|nr:glycosyltransferase family 2 protein [Arthrobacter sp. UNC362MFTsu5.1]
MKISVITIAYNDLEGVRKTVNSVQQQSYAEIEHIVVDGGSTDGTREFLESLDGSVQWVSERDNGRYDAMNKGAKIASGDLLWFMHSADIFHSNSSTDFVAYEFSKNKFDWGYGLSRIVDDKDTLGIAGQIPFEHARFLIGGKIIPHQASVFSREFFWALNGYDTEFGLTADQEFMMRASMESLPSVWAEVLCDFDAGGAGSTRNAWAHYQDMIRARSISKIKVTSSATLDSALSIFFCGFTMVDRILRRPLRRSSPTVTIAGSR